MIELRIVLSYIFFSVVACLLYLLLWKRLLRPYVRSASPEKASGVYLSRGLMSAAVLLMAIQVYLQRVGG